MNDTIRPGVTIGIPGSGQRIEDLTEFYSHNDIESPFDPSIAVSYAAERLTSNRPSISYVYNHLRQPLSLEG